MIVRRVEHPETLEIVSDGKKIFRVTILDASNNAQDLTALNIFSTGVFKILAGDFTFIDSVPISYFDRPNGIIEFEIDESIATNENAGNWNGKIELINENGKKVAQQYLNFNIRESDDPT